MSVRATYALTTALLLALAAYFVLVELHKQGFIATDIYGYYLPIKMYAAQCVLDDGGKGLLWTPFHTFGQPFFANPAVALLYPINVLYLLFEPNVAVHLMLVINIALGAVGMLLLLREVGLSWVAAIGGAAFFELGHPMALLSGWDPMHNGPWTCVPWALLLCERLLKRPSQLRVIALAAVLSVSILAGWVLITALTYQVIALRVVWELLLRRQAHSVRAAVATVIALALVPFLVAVQIIPAAEVAQESFRIETETDDLARSGGGSVGQILGLLQARKPPIPFFAAALPLAAVALVGTRLHGLALFWFLVGVAYTVLAMGHATPLYAIFSQVVPPGAGLIKYSERLFIVVGLCLSMVTAFAIDAYADRAAPNRLFALRFAVAVAIGAVLLAMVPGGLRPSETTVLAVLIVACAAALAQPLRVPVSWLLVAAVVYNVTAVPIRFAGALVPSIDAYFKFEHTFDAVRQAQTAQDRVLLHPSIGSSMSLTLTAKTASTARLRDVYDYDALIGQRVFAYYSFLHVGEVLFRPADLLSPSIKRELRRRLVDVGAIRHLITVPGTHIAKPELGFRRLLSWDEGIEVYVNDAALPRARFVPQVEVVPDPAALLNRLAYGSDDLAAVAFVEEPLPGAFHGAGDTTVRGTASFVRDDPEHLVIDVNAPVRGFLTVADQHFPGWHATVNGRTTPIVRANYAFRLVEVPAGESRVELRYRPTTVTIGAAISAATIIVVVALLWRIWRRPMHTSRSAWAHGGPA